MPQQKSPRPLELLSPARNADIAIEAVRHGADAVYIGAPTHSARAAAGVTVSDIARAADYAHRFNARIYVALNTIIMPDELAGVEKMIWSLYRAGADALIIQDLGILRMDLPPIALHASTQCDIRTPERARFLEACGMSQIVIARELTLDETAEISRAVTVPVEAFVHGALCVSYSGACYASLAATGRSANRGECAQLCRLPYDLIDAQGNILMENSHLLSLRDLNRSAMIGRMAAAGVSSFKIEGRLKDASYVKNVTAAYRLALDSIIDANPQLYRRASSGRTELAFTPSLTKSFNRGFTDYFTTSRRPDRPGMASLRSPKWLGETIGRVISSRGNFIEVKLSPGIKLNNGDGLGYFDPRGNFNGFRLNRVEGNRLFPATSLSLQPGTPLLRNRDKAWDDEISRSSTSRRVIPASLTLRTTPRGIAIDITDSDGHEASVASDITLSEARTPQTANRRKILEKSGDTDFSITEVCDLAGNLFIPASLLTPLRRDLLEALARTRLTSYHYDRRRPQCEAELARLAPLQPESALNVANQMAAKVYTEAGLTSVAPARETTLATPDGSRLMTTRYCLRREAGRCLRTPSGAKWPEKLFIKSGRNCFALQFDCKKCEMHVNYVAHPDNFS
ncbi:MAG: U32 family peptidase [Bacteroides sp.]|nr:U32 family peptidase [Bacteroides sp.]